MPTMHVRPLVPWTVAVVAATMAIAPWCSNAYVVRGKDADLTSILIDPTTVIAKPSLTPTKEELFVQWMSSDSFIEIPHPGIALNVQGTIPSYVQGYYIKNGPGALSTPDQSQRYTHVFDGLAKLQKFDIHGNTVAFTTRFVESGLKKLMLQQNTIPAHMSFGPVEPKVSPWHVLCNTLYDGMLNTVRFDNPSVNVEEVSSSGVYCAVTDSTVRRQIDIDTLQTLGRLPARRIRGMPSTAQFSTAHAKVAPNTGLSYNYVLETHGGRPQWAHVVRTNRDLTRTSIGKVKVDTDHKFPYVHDLSVTDNYAIVILSPLVLDIGKAIETGCLLPVFEFNQQETTTICVFDLHGIKPVQTFETIPFWCYHHVNAYEDNDSLILDVLAYETSEGIANGLSMDSTTEQARLAQKSEGSIWRFALDVTDDAVRTVSPQRKTVHDPDTGLLWSMELTTVAPHCLGKPYRYAYGCACLHRGVPGMLDWALYKQDVTSVNHGVWYEEFMYPGEATFVPNPNGVDEDDGVLLSSVYDSRRRENCLLVLDARTMKELARAYTGVAFPQGFHGKFFAKPNVQG